MELEDIYENVENNDIKNTTGPQKQNHSQDEGKAQKKRGSRCLVLLTVCLGLICVVLLIFIIIITAERDLLKSHKNTAEELNQTINSLQDNYTDLMTEKDQLKNNFSSLSQKKLELETRVNDLTAEKGQLQRRVDSLSQKKLELETRVNDLTAEKGQLQRRVDSLSQKKLELENELRKLSERGNGRFLMSSEEKSWSDSRQYCRDRGADLIVINTEEKQKFISSFMKEAVWIGLSDIENERRMKWVDNSPLKQGFWASNEPNDAGGNEDCIELNPAKPVLSNWNDIPCSAMRKWICEN